MPALINQIKYQAYGLSVPSYPVPVIEVASNDMAYGTVDATAVIDQIYTVTAAIYEVTSPTTAEWRWIRASENLYVPGCLSVTVSDIIHWQFEPAVLGLVNGDYVSIEFTINGGDVTKQQCHPKVIIKIKDQIRSL